MPGEWEHHERTYLGWPQWLEDPKEGQKDLAQVAFAAVAKAIAEFEPVTVAANPDQVTPVHGNARSSVGRESGTESETRLLFAGRVQLSDDVDGALNLKSIFARSAPDAT